MTARPVLADVGPLYAAVDPDDQHHARARREIEELNRRGAGVAVAYPTLAEACTLVLYRLGPRRAVRFGQEMTAGTTLLNPTPDDYRQALARLAAYRDLPVSLFDGVVSVLSERSNLEVWTYDQHFHAMGTQVWQADPDSG